MAAASSDSSVPGFPHMHPLASQSFIGVNIGAPTTLWHLCAEAHLLLRSLSLTGLRLRLLCSPSLRLLLPSFLSNDSFSSSAAVSASLLACAHQTPSALYKATALSSAACSL